MTKAYADLHLLPNVKDNKKVLEMVSKASELGYRLVALTFPQNFFEEDIQQLRMKCQEYAVDLVSRVDLNPKTPKELIRNLRVYRRKFEVLAVLCESKSVARQAAKDRRVDLLNFPAFHHAKRFFDIAEAELASKSLASLEIDINPILRLEGTARIRLIASLRRETLIAKKFDVPIVISSGVSDVRLMRKPKEQAALASLFDLDEASAIQAVSKNPVAIVNRNREKLNPKFVAPGIRIIRWGKDC
ncbi:MAG: RNase P subunit p30 family protein [Candidatus Bathyarchaeia archaeon]